MTQVATPATILGDFGGVRLEREGRVYRLGTDSEGAWVRRLDDAASELERSRRRVLMSTGSHFDQVYWLETRRDDRLVDPFEFYHSRRLDRWLPMDAAYLADPEVHGAAPRRGDWNGRCIRCHATAGAFRAAPRDGAGGWTFDTRVAEFGIACEACHGPGGAHVAAHRNPVHRVGQHLRGESDGTIVDPEELDHRRASRICGQCHSISFQPGSHEEKARFEPDPFRPGMDPDEDRRIFDQQPYIDPSYEPAPPEEERHRKTLALLRDQPDLLPTSFWDDGMVRISGRDYSSMIDSPCYERGEISCLSCHAMHQSPEDERSIDEWAHHQLRPDVADNRACTQCHTGFEDGERLVSHTHHAEASAGSSCYECHMPYTTYGMWKGIRNHQIASPTARESVEVGRPNACNLCHLDQSLAWTAEHLEAWYGTPPPSLSEDQRTIGAGALWTLTGRAGVRAIAAYAMGRDVAREASGSAWMSPILSQLLADPYYAVRYIAWSSLKQQDEFADFEYDFVTPGEAQQDALFRARLIWSGQRVDVSRRPSPRALLRNERAELLFAELDRLLDQRDDTPVYLAE